MKGWLYQQPKAKIMITKSPSGALSPYYYKGGYFHGIHYGSYFNDSDALLFMMKKEEEFILKSPEKRRILIDLYETTLTKALTEKITEHINRLRPNIVKLAITATPKNLHKLHKALTRNTPQLPGRRKTGSRRPNERAKGLGRMRFSVPPSAH